MGLATRTKYSTIHKIKRLPVQENRGIDPEFFGVVVMGILLCDRVVSVVLSLVAVVILLLANGVEVTICEEKVSGSSLPR